jgi:putative tryptophan/tyrosine transport system substrate-binding protein
MQKARRRYLALLLAPFAAPSGVFAQQRKPWRIGYLAQAAPQVNPDSLGQFRKGLEELGYVEGRDYALLVRNAEGKPERLDAFAAELVRMPVDIIVAGTTPPAVAAMKATRSIPIVFAVAGDPVGSGLVQALARPGGNATGNALAFDELCQKWLELLLTLRPRSSRVVVLTNPTNDSMRSMLEPLGVSARHSNVALMAHELSPGGDPKAALEKVKADRPDGLVVLPDAYIRTQLAHIANAAVRMRIPAVYGNRPFAEAGGLMSYGADQREHFRRTATYVDRILKGAKPAELPVERPTKFELVINLKAAKAAGLTIPTSLLGRADAVIE